MAQKKNKGVKGKAFEKNFKVVARNKMFFAHG